LKRGSVIPATLITGYMFNVLVDQDMVFPSAYRG